MPTIKPGLFGLKNTNRDFTRRETWGKNQFNSSFPAALCCYLHHKKIEANYLCMSKGNFFQSTIPIDKIFGIDPLSEDVHFAFEAPYSPYNKFVFGELPRTDLVIQNMRDGVCLNGLEVKLTALPDNTTCDFGDELYGSEIVVRPDTIVYLAASIAISLGGLLDSVVPDIVVRDWSQPADVLKQIKNIVNSIKLLAASIEMSQKAFLIQPIWKTLGKSPELAENCLDVFVWSDAGFCHFISEIAGCNTESNGITRQKRTVIWLYKMLHGIKTSGKFNHEEIIDMLSYNTKNDKAFASAGNVTNKYMRCGRLTKPIVKKSQIKEIILGGGQELLSPERRFDAILFNSPDLFK